MNRDKEFEVLKLKSDIERFCNKEKFINDTERSKYIGKSLTVENLNTIQMIFSARMRKSNKGLAAVKYSGDYISQITGEKVRRYNIEFYDED